MSAPSFDAPVPVADRGANMMTAMPINMISAPRRSQRVGRTPSMAHSQSRHCHIHSAVSGVDTPRRRRMQRQKPDKHRQALGGRRQQPRQTVLAEPQVRQIATNQLRDGGCDEQQDGLPNAFQFDTPSYFRLNRIEAPFGNQVTVSGSTSPKLRENHFSAPITR